MNTENTNRISLKMQYEYNIKQVLFATQMSDDELSFFIDETAYCWLQRFFKGVVDIDTMMHNDGFSSWWKFHWCDRDDRFFLELLWDEPEDFRFAKYRMVHQCVFKLLQPTTQYMYQDFKDMLPTFEPVGAD